MKENYLPEGQTEEVKQDIERTGYALRRILAKSHQGFRILKALLFLLCVLPEGYRGILLVVRETCFFFLIFNRKIYGISFLAI